LSENYILFNFYYLRSLCLAYRSTFIFSKSNKLFSCKAPIQRKYSNASYVYCRYVCLSVCVSVCVFVCLSMCLSVCVSIFFVITKCTFAVLDHRPGWATVVKREGAL